MKAAVKILQKQGPEKLLLIQHRHPETRAYEGDGRARWGWEWVIVLLVFLVSVCAAGSLVLAASNKTGEHWVTKKPSGDADQALVDLRLGRREDPVMLRFVAEFTHKPGYAWRLNDQKQSLLVDLEGAFPQDKNRNVPLHPGVSKVDLGGLDQGRIVVGYASPVEIVKHFLLPPEGKHQWRLVIDAWLLPRSEIEPQAANTVVVDFIPLSDPMDAEEMFPEPVMVPDAPVVMAGVAEPEPLPIHGPEPSCNTSAAPPTPGNMGDGPPKIEIIEDPPTWYFYTSLKSEARDRPLLNTGGKRTQVDSKFRVGLRYTQPFAISWELHADAQGVFQYKFIDDDGDIKHDYVYGELKRFYLRGEDLFNHPFLWTELGRMRVHDHRSWFYDDEMEAVRFGWDSTLFDAHAGVAGWLWDGRVGDYDTDTSGDESVEAVGSIYAFANLEYQPYYHYFIGLNGVYENYESPEDLASGDRITNPEDLTVDSHLGWVSLYSHGEKPISSNTLEYSVEVGTVWGEHHGFLVTNTGQVMGTETRTLEGEVAGDLRLIGRFDHNRYAVGAGYGYGSEYYRQPQTAANKDNILGFTRYRYYGEVLGPRLTNLHVFSLWGGLALSESVWLEGAYHYYQQQRATTRFLSEDDLFIPSGTSSDLGQALDMVLGGRLNPKWDLSLALGTFWTGEAFDDPNRYEDCYYRASMEISKRW